jgi:hypothetical protein
LLPAGHVDLDDLDRWVRVGWERRLGASKPRSVTRRSGSAFGGARMTKDVRRRCAYQASQRSMACLWFLGTLATVKAGRAQTGEERSPLWSSRSRRDSRCRRTYTTWRMRPSTSWTERQPDSAGINVGSNIGVVQLAATRHRPRLHRRRWRTASSRLCPPRHSDVSSGPPQAWTPRPGAQSRSCPRRQRPAARSRARCARPAGSDGDRSQPSSSARSFGGTSTPRVNDMHPDPMK